MNQVTEGDTYVKGLGQLREGKKLSLPLVKKDVSLSLGYTYTEGGYSEPRCFALVCDSKTKQRGPPTGHIYPNQVCTED